MPTLDTLDTSRCIFEVYATLLHSEHYGKLQVRAGSVNAAGELRPCNDHDTLATIASTVDAGAARATVESDKVMILARLEDLGAGDRNGAHELNRKLARAVRRGW